MLCFVSFSGTQFAVATGTTLCCVTNRSHMMGIPPLVSLHSPMQPRDGRIIPLKAAAAAATREEAMV